jgi:hypothetical protein
MKQIEKLASSIYLIKRAENPPLFGKNEEKSDLTKLLTALGGALGGLAAGGIGGRAAGMKLLPNLLKKLDLRNLKNVNTSPFALRKNLTGGNKNLYRDVGADLGLNFGGAVGSVGGHHLAKSEKK